MSDKWRGLHGSITAELAEAEPEHERLLGPSYAARQRRRAARGLPGGIDRVDYQPWKKPRIIRSANSSMREGVSDRES